MSTAKPTDLMRLTKAQLAERLEGEAMTSSFLEERLVDLELALEDRDWLKLTAEGEEELTPEGIIRIIHMARSSYLSNPLINHAVNVQANYVFAQGMNITTKGSTADALKPVLGNERNKAELFGHQARWMKEIGLQLEANIFFVFFTNESSGDTKVGTIPPEEVLRGDIIRNPQDRKEPWYYKRVWRTRELNIQSGAITTSEKVDYYPDFRYEPEAKPAKIGDKTVHWDMPVYHVKVGGLTDSKFGVPEVYSALDWAKAVRRDLEDYATLRRALARFAWRIYTKGGKAGVAAAKSKLESAIGPLGDSVNRSGLDSNPPPGAGAAWISAEGRQLEPIKTSGATINPEEGRRLWYMISAGTGIPEPILAGSADSGSWATAKSLDRPTELQMRNRQTLWMDIHYTILNFILKKRKAAGKFEGSELADGMLMITNAAGEKVEPELVVSFPNILERDTKSLVDAVVAAATLNGKENAGLFEIEMLSRMLLEALSVDDVDKMMSELFPEGEEPALPPGPLPERPISNEELASSVQEVLREVVAIRESRNGATE